MQLAFETKRLRDICENEERAADELGTKVAEQLKRRLADLRAAESIEEMPNIVKPSKGSTKCSVLFAEDRLYFAPITIPTQPRNLARSIGRKSDVFEFLRLDNR